MNDKELVQLIDEEVLVATADGHWNTVDVLRAAAARIEAGADLLAALKKCAAVVAGETMHKGGLVEALEAARAAIAKYRSEQ